MPQTIKVRAGDTEPLELTIDATGLDNLDDLDAAVLYLRKSGESENHVDGATLSVADSATKTLAFDPVNAKNPSGDALDEDGTYSGYVKATWNDADITRHPADPDEDITVIVAANLED
jgi:hypothetical protein